MKKQTITLTKTELSRLAKNLELEEKKTWDKKKDVEGYYALLDIAWQCARIRGMKQVCYDLLGRFSE